MKKLCKVITNDRLSMEEIIHQVMVLYRKNHVLTVGKPETQRW